MKTKKDGFHIGFDEHIPVCVRNELRRFVQWLEFNFEMPVPICVDFEYKHYLVSRKKERVGFLFYWEDDPSEMPVLRLPVRTEKSSMKEILGSFAEAMDYYFTWIKGEMHDEYEADEQRADAILEAYLQYAEQGGK